MEDGSSYMKYFRKNSFSSLYKTVPSEECAVSLPYLRHLLWTTSPVFNYDLPKESIPYQSSLQWFWFKLKQQNGSTCHLCGSVTAKIVYFILNVFLNVHVAS